MKIIEQDILTVKQGTICHQVNCQGVMGGGLALSIRNKWPHVYEKYKNFCKRADYWPMDLLGMAESVEINDKLIVYNIFGQFDFGGGGERHTDYCALNNAFHHIKEIESAANTKLDIYFPYLMGCDRGGGDWRIVSKMIEHYFPNAIICKLPSNA